MSQEWVDDCFSGSHQGQSDLLQMEKNFAAIKSCFSGSVEPSSAYRVAGIWWYDTSANILKIRNEGNSSWLSVFDFGNNRIAANKVTVESCDSSIKNPAAGSYGLRSLGTESTQACAGNDSRLSDQRTPPDNSVTQAKMADNAIGQAELKTATEVESVAGSLGAWHRFTWSSVGEHGFTPQFKVSGSAGMGSGAEVHWHDDTAGDMPTSYTTMVDFYENTTNTIYAQIRYVTASGEYAWVFRLIDKETGKLIRSNYSDDHCSIHDESKEHPFGNLYDPEKHRIECIVLTADEANTLHVEAVKCDKCVLQLINEDYEVTDENVTPYPTEPITMGLAKTIMVDDGKGGQKEIVPDYRMMPSGTKVPSIKRNVTKPAYITLKGFKKK